MHESKELVLVPSETTIMMAENSIFDLLKTVEQARIRLEEQTAILGEVIRDELRALRHIRNPKLKHQLHMSLMELDVAAADRPTGSLGNYVEILFCTCRQKHL